MNETEERILQGATSLFQEKGLKFTMQDIATELQMAKKTIYQYYDSKEALLMALLDHGFAKIQANKKAIIESDMPIQEKIRKVMIAMPDQYQLLDFRKLSELHARYPAVEKELNQKLEADWEPILQLLETGIAEGDVRNINLTVFRMMITSTMESFLANGLLEKNEISYNDALNSLMDIVMKGILEDANEKNQ